jgi:hypothetical protein
MHRPPRDDSEAKLQKTFAAWGLFIMAILGPIIS